MTKEISWLLFIAALLASYPLHMADALTIKTARRIVVLDPGHGGDDPGITSATGILEKQVVLKLAQMTAQRLSDQYHLLLTRTTDRSVSTTDRTAFTNQNKADLFLSLHLHAQKNKAFLFYFDTPQTISMRNPVDWRTQSLIHQDKSRQTAVRFATLFHRVQKQDTPLYGPAPGIPLEGLLMTALLIEPFTITGIPAEDGQERFLAPYAELLARCIEAYFEKDA